MPRRSSGVGHAGLPARMGPPSRTRRIAIGLVAAAMVAAPSLGRAQNDGAPSHPEWPCRGRVDPVYFNGAEATGGHLLLLAPWEAGDSFKLLAAWDSHPSTILRLGGTMPAGLRDFHVPIDGSVESVVFSVGIQCLTSADVISPSGAPLVGDNATTLEYTAQRMVTVRAPERGTWTIRAEGSGIASIIVQAKSELDIGTVTFHGPGSSTFTRVPVPDVENVVRMRLSLVPAEVHASVVDGWFRRIAALPLTVSEDDGAYVSRFTPGTQPFRVVVAGRDPAGLPFQRVTAPLVSPR